MHLRDPILHGKKLGAYFFGVLFANVLSASVFAHSLMPEVEITDHYDAEIGESESASQGSVGPSLLKNRPLLRPADALENIPGMVVTQHSGDGKANQYFLRGINLDHGTDFATQVNGVPVNLPTHAHGHGYSDLNFLIPELVQRVDYRKGPYFASDGDFSAAGSANFVYRTRLAQPFVDLSLGQSGYRRALVAGSQSLGEDRHLLMALEQMRQNGPWTVPENLNKKNALITLSQGSKARGWSTSLSAYRAQWTATDQVPQRLIDSGSYLGQPFGRFDSLDPSDGGHTSRTSLSGDWRDSSNHASSKFNWYAIRYDLDLYSNFTYQTASNGTGTSDQFAQRDNRTVLGGSASQSWQGFGWNNTPMVNTLGIQVRRDNLRVSLLNTQQRVVTQTVRDDSIQQTLVGIYGENEMTWQPWFKTIAGMRWDQLNVPKASHTSQLASPKLSIILRPWSHTELFINTGYGFHSNDARSLNSSSSANSGLTRARGDEIGVRTQALDTLHTAIAVWRLRFNSELTYLGDAGETKAGRPSERIGLEWSNQWRPSEKFWLDANFAWTRPRYSGTAPADEGNFIPNAVQRVANVSAVLRGLGGDFKAWTASFHLRYVGPAALTSDNSVQSSASLSTQVRLSRQLSPNADVSLDIFNVTNRANNDIQYYYASQVGGETAAVNDRHVHPAEPRSLRISARLRF